MTLPPTEPQLDYVRGLLANVARLAHDGGFDEVVVDVKDIDPDKIPDRGAASEIIEELKGIAQRLRNMKHRVNREKKETAYQKQLREAHEWNEEEERKFRAQFNIPEDERAERPCPWDQPGCYIWKAAPTRQHVFGLFSEPQYNWKWSCTLPHWTGNAIGGGSSNFGWRGTRDGLERHMKKYHS